MVSAVNFRTDINFNVFHFYIPFTNIHGKFYAKMCLINGFLKGTKRITFKTNKKINCK